jgi:competence protein ComEC
MCFLILFVIGIGCSLFLRQAGLPVDVTSPLAGTLWSGYTAVIVLIVPLFGAAAGALLMIRYQAFAVRIFALVVFLLGFGVAGLDTRAPDLPRYWNDQIQGPRWVFGKIVGLPEMSVVPAGRVSGSDKSQVVWRFQFMAKCWQAFRHKAGPDLKHRSNSRGRCQEPTQNVAGFWRSLRLTFYVDGEQANAIGALMVPGQWAWLPVKLKRMRGQNNPGAFDYGRWAFVNGIGARGQVIRQAAPSWLHRQAGFDAFRARASDHLRLRLAAYPAAQRLLPAFMLGDRRWLLSSDWKALNRAGLGHLVAISGLHVGFAAFLGYVLGLFFLRRVTYWFPVIAAHMPLQLGAWGLAWCAGAMYSVLSGFAMTTVRALLALTLLCVCRWRFRQLPMVLVWGLCGVTMLCFSPRWVFDVSFLLSFGAVGILIWCSSFRVMSESTAGQAWRLQWGLSVGLSPLNVAFFSQVTWLSPLINFFAIPVFSFFLIPALVFVVFVGPLWPEASSAVLQWVADVLVRGLAFVVRLSDLPQTATAWMVPSGLSLLAMVGAFVLWLLSNGWRLKGLACIVLLIAVFHQDEPTVAPGGFRLTVLDVGQGLAVALQTRHHTLVYDPGPAYGTSHTVERIWTPFLRYFKRASVDMMVLSHGDADHAGSAPFFVNQIKTRQYMSLESMPSLQPPHVPCRAGHFWVWDGVRFDVLYPEPADPERRNSSCVIRVIGEQHSVLLTGDIDAQMEAQLLERYSPDVTEHKRVPVTVRDLAPGHLPIKPLPDLHADILLVPHHGSKSSSSTGLIHHVAPAWALVSHGHNNSFGHPHSAIKARYLVRGVNWLSTADQGAITFLSMPEYTLLPMFVGAAGSQHGAVATISDLVVQTSRAHQRFWFF